MVIDSLRRKDRLPAMEVRDIPGKGRGVFLLEGVKRNAFLCEYKSESVYPRRDRQRHEDMYRKNREGCMILGLHARGTGSNPRLF